jgi:hypothetical protein
LWWAVWWWTFPEENLSTDFTHEPNEVVPAKAQAGWEESSSLISKRQMTDLSCSCIAKKSLKRDLVVSTDGCQEKWVKPNPNCIDCHHASIKVLNILEYH